MSRRVRQLWRGAVATSAAILAVTAALWATSYAAPWRFVAVRTLGGGVTSYNGMLRLVRVRGWPDPPPTAFAWGKDWVFNGYPYDLPSSSSPRYELLGGSTPSSNALSGSATAFVMFRPVNQSPQVGTAHDVRAEVWWLSFPYWQLALATGALPAGAVVRLALPALAAARARRRLAREGKCPACGYDLRATPERCPECGTSPTSGARRIIC